MTSPCTLLKPRTPLLRSLSRRLSSTLPSELGPRQSLTHWNAPLQRLSARRSAATCANGSPSSGTFPTRRPASQRGGTLPRKGPVRPDGAALHGKEGVVEDRLDCLYL